MADLVNISIATGGAVALLGYAVVFLGLILLMITVMIMSKIMMALAAKKAAAVTAGELKLYDTDPRDAAMIMAIVADTLGKPLNELRFISIKEVKDDEI